MQSLNADHVYIGLRHVELVLAIGKVPIFFNIKDILVTLAAEEQSIFGQALNECLRISHLNAILIDPSYFGCTMLCDLALFNAFFLHNSLDSFDGGVVGEEGILLFSRRSFAIRY